MLPMVCTVADLKDEAFAGNHATAQNLAVAVGFVGVIKRPRTVSKRCSGHLQITV